MLSSLPSSSVSDSTFMIAENKTSETTTAMNSSNKFVSDFPENEKKLSLTTSMTMTMGIIPDYNDDICIDGDEDIIMQLEEDEGLLPDIWNHKSHEYEQSSFYNTTTTTTNISSPNSSSIISTPFSDDVAVLSSDESSIDDDSHSHHSEDSSDSFFSQQEENFRSSSAPSSSSSTANTTAAASSSSFAESNFYGRLETLHDSMKRSYQTRHALFYSDYRSRQTDEVLMRAEYSTYQVDCYVRGYLMNMNQHQFQHHQNTV